MSAPRTRSVSEYWIVGVVTLATTVGLNVWGKGQARVFCAMMGIIVGYVAAMVTGLLPVEAFRDLADLPLVAVPLFAHPGWSLSPAMIPPFFVAAIAITLKGGRRHHRLPAAQRRGHG